MNPLGGITGMRITRAPLTARQKQIYDFIVHQIRTVGPPTHREIMERFDIGSTNAVVCHLQSMAKKGWITVEKWKSRGIRLIAADGACPACGCRCRGRRAVA